ncbi:hypothetical protein SEA_STORMINNORM_62 [Gordonia Phage StorminNorm]|nr:hypothetical protein SEA_FLATWOODS_62 [Gordonia phage Flatwoods]UTN91716.1 hypothetical protein SEA_STORMINNORM_62 [Gordonia Phage StorminNorm]
MSYAHICTLCNHLASRHFLDEADPDATLVDGPYRCTHRDCDCTISQRTPTTGVSERRFDAEFAPHLDEYDPIPERQRSE